jgi:hypothetical protein
MGSIVFDIAQKLTVVPLLELRHIGFADLSRNPDECLGCLKVTTVVAANFRDDLD